MIEKPVYFDIRSDFWKRHFEMADEYDAFLAKSDRQHSHRWAESAERTPALTPEQLDRLQGWNRSMNVLMYCGVWCGDCSRQGPMLKMIADACGELVSLRLIDREASEELKNELRLVGATRVPVVVFLSEDWWEVGRFGDRMLTVYRAKATREVGRPYDAGVLSRQAMERELEEWVSIFERMLIMLRLSPPLRRRHGD